MTYTWENWGNIDDLRAGDSVVIKGFRFRIGHMGLIEEVTDSHIMILNEYAERLISPESPIGLLRNIANEVRDEATDLIEDAIGRGDIRLSNFPVSEATRWRFFAEILQLEAEQYNLIPVETGEFKIKVRHEENNTVIEFKSAELFLQGNPGFYITQENDTSSSTPSPS